MNDSYEFLLTVGAILLFGLLTTALGRHTFLPRVTLLLLFGVIIGKEVLDLVPALISQRFEIIANMALLMIGFLLGGKLTAHSLKKSINKVFWISISAALVSTVVVTVGLVIIGTPLHISILLGCIASATAPAATFDVVLESGFKGPFSDLLLTVVALDDAWALILFALGMAIVSAMSGIDTDHSILIAAGRDIGGAVILGLVLGFPGAYLTGRIKPGQPVLSEALGLVFICGGLAIWLGVSFLIASMVLGAVVANFASHHEYPFHAIEDIESPFMVIFFVLAGASLELSAVADIGLAGLVFIVCRTLGKILGARIGCQCCSTDALTKRWIGVALLPQAGVAIGMALVASNYFPEYRQILLTVVISSTIFFEIIGPVLTRLALNKVHR